MDWTRWIALPLLLLAACSESAVPPSPWSADAVRDLLEQDPAARSALGGNPEGPVYCGVDVLGGSTDGRYVYAWAGCLTFSCASEAVETGTSVPLRVDTTGRTVDLPGDGAQYAAGLRRLFPAELGDRLSAEEVTLDRTESELRARAVADRARC